MLSLSIIQRFREEVAENSAFNVKAELIRCMGDPTCLKILYILTKEKEVCPSDLVGILDLSMPAISHQLSKLKQIGIVSSTRMGQTICYEFSDKKEASFIKSLMRKSLKL